MTGTLAFVRFALTQRVDLVSDNYYERASSYDSVMASQQRGFEASGVSVLLSPDSVIITRTGSNAVSDVNVQCYRPSDPSFDRSFAVAFDSAGRFVLPIENIATGYWKVRLSGVSDNAAFSQEWPWMRR
jgi:hypothetical protein